MSDENIVQTGEVSEETPSPEGVAPEVTPQIQPLSPEIETKIQESIAKALGEATEKGRREIQSVKDSARAEVEAAYRRAKIAETTLAGMSTEPTDDPERAELMRRRAADRARQLADVEGFQRQQAESFNQTFYNNMLQFVTSTGIDPNNPEIDWGNEEVQQKGDYLAAQQKILGSVNKILVGEKKTSEAKRTQEKKDLEAKIRKEQGIDSVETSVTSSAEGDDAVFLSKYSRGDSDDHTRARKILSKLK